MLFDPNYLSGLVGAVDQSSSVESNLTAELSSGLRVTSLQDDPGAVANASMIGSSIARDDSYVQSATGTQAMLQVADSALGEVVTQVTSALTLAVQAGSGGLNASNIATIVQQLTGIRDQVLSLANTSYLGQHLFGGSQGSAPPFSLDTTTVPATTIYSGDQDVQSIETPMGQKIQVSVPGSAIFGGGGPGVLAQRSRHLRRDGQPRGGRRPRPAAGSQRQRGLTRRLRSRELCLMRRSHACVRANGLRS